MKEKRQSEEYKKEENEARKGRRKQDQVREEAK